MLRELYDHGLKNVLNFKNAILVGSLLAVYSRLMLNKTIGKGSRRKKKKYLLCESKVV